MEALSGKRLSDYIAEQIADEILSGRMDSNFQLRQEELAETLGASRIPIREALQTLESQGLAVRLATKRIYTVELDDEKITEIYETICSIEKEALKSIKRSGTLPLIQKKIEKLRSVNSMDLHRTVYQNVGNVYLSNLLKSGTECYIRYACQIDGESVNVHQAETELYTVLMDGNLRSINAGLDAYFSILAKNVKEERRGINERTSSN